MSIQTSDRYDALGIPRPDPETMCKGECEGTGVVPVFIGERLNPGPNECVPKASETDQRLVALWREAEEKEHAENGYHFVPCPDCRP